MTVVVDPAAPLLALEGVWVSFGDTVALQGANLELVSGEVVALLGPSGCGKSTLLRVVSGLQPPDQGVVRLGGIDVTDVAPHERRVGLMFQDHALFPHLDVGGNIAFGLRMAGESVSRQHERVDELLELVGLGRFTGRAVATLSGGEAQRVALARTLAPAPRLVLLDEPLGSLDRVRRDQLVDDLPRVLAATGTAAIHVTHDHDEAFAVADRIAVMDAGQILQTGAPAEVWERPVNETVARFLGHTNIVDGPNGRQVIRADGARLASSGRLIVRVRAVRFQGHHWEVEGEADGYGPLRFILNERPPRDPEIRLDLDSGAVIDLA